MGMLKFGFLSFCAWAFLTGGLFAGASFEVSYDRSALAESSENGDWTKPARGYVVGDIAIMDTVGMNFHHGHTFVSGDQILFVEGEPAVKHESELSSRSFIRLGRLSTQGYHVSAADFGFYDWPITFEDSVRSTHTSLIGRLPPDNREKLYNLITLKVRFAQEAAATKEKILQEIADFQKFAVETPKKMFKDKTRYLSVVGEDEMLPFDRIEFVPKKYIRSSIPFLSGDYSSIDLIGSQFEVTIKFSKGKKEGKTTLATLRLQPDGKLKLSFQFPRRFGRYDTYVSRSFRPEDTNIHFDMKAHGLTVFRLREKQGQLCWKNLADLFPE